MSGKQAAGEHIWPLQTNATECDYFYYYIWLASSNSTAASFKSRSCHKILKALGRFLVAALDNVTPAQLFFKIQNAYAFVGNLSNTIRRTTANQERASVVGAKLRQSSAAAIMRLHCPMDETKRPYTQ